jgi:transposase-like protein
MPQASSANSTSTDLTLPDLMPPSEEQARLKLAEIFWGSTTEQVCPKCGVIASHYVLKTRKQWRCREKLCRHTFSVTSGTPFADHKISHKKLLLALFVFVVHHKGMPALELQRMIGGGYRTSFTLFHKLREALLNTVPQQKLSGVVEIDGAHFSGRPRKGRKKKPVPINTTENKYRAQHRSKLPDSAFPHHPNRRIVMIMREHNSKGRGAGRSVVEICPSETAPYIDGLVKKWVEVGSTVRTGELPAYKNLPEIFYKRESVNHSIEFSTNDGVNENQAESFFSRFRRAQKGVYHRITPRYMHDYANEMVWREDVRREAPGSQLRILVRRVFYAGRSEDWRGYCQKNSRQEERLFMAAA